MNTINLEKGQNTGVIIDVRPTDFLAGGETGIAYEARNLKGDWAAFISANERQSIPGGYDSLSCVTFSALNILEIQLNWLAINGMIPDEVLQELKELGFVTEAGFNFSDWFTAVASGTNAENGNTLQAVWDSIRHIGAIPQKDGHELKDFASAEEWLDPRGITPAHLEKAKRFKEFFEVAYEWVVLGEQGAWDTFAHHVKQAPLHIATPTCASWNSPEGTIVDGCGSKKTLNHATAYIGQKVEAYHKDLDHYVPFIKLLAWDYYMPYAIKAVVTVKGQMPKPVPETPGIPVKIVDEAHYGDDNEAVRKIQAVLHVLYSNTTGKSYLKDGVYGPYGPQTKTAVNLLQQEHGIDDPDFGDNVGPKTVEVLNRLLALRIKE